MIKTIIALLILFLLSAFIVTWRESRLEDEDDL